MIIFINCLIITFYIIYIYIYISFKLYEDLIVFIKFVLVAILFLFMLTELELVAILSLFASIFPKLVAISFLFVEISL